jgi:hypothetical protein
VISFVTGTLGSGKSLYGARATGRALLEGRVVATNMRLVDGWERLVLLRSPYYRFSSKAGKREYEREIRRRYAYVPEIWKLLAARIHGRGEHRGLMVLDEAHNELNNREWAEDNQKQALRKLTLARKRGWRVMMISQHRDNTDAAARRVATFETKCLNWKQMTRLPVLGVSPLPRPVFLAQTYRVNQAKNVSATDRMYGELYRLGWYRHLYDTFEDFDGGLGEDPEALWLPLPVEDEGRPALAGGHRPTPNGTEAHEDPSARLATLPTIASAPPHAKGTGSHTDAPLSDPRTSPGDANSRTA